jgi:hypothetical protein
VQILSGEASEKAAHGCGPRGLTGLPQWKDDDYQMNGSELFGFARQMSLDV